MTASDHIIALGILLIIIGFGTLTAWSIYQAWLYSGFVGVGLASLVIGFVTLIIGFVVDDI
jgi:uncharacterized membrane protein